MVEWITDTMDSLGYLGIGFLMFMENIFPPIPSELIMPLAGFTVAQGKMQIVPAIAAGVMGTMLGTLPWYYIGKFVGENRLRQWADHYGKWLGITSDDFDKAKQWFNRHGTKTVFYCRMVPGVRTFISLPAGFSDMPIVPFLIYSTLGTTAWVGLLTFAGYVLGDHYELVEEYLGVISKIVLLTLIAVFVAWVVKRRRKPSV
jgi:membrane protein DedA with SNARE-associated domain